MKIDVSDILVSDGQSKKISADIALENAEFNGNFLRFTKPVSVCGTAENGNEMAKLALDMFIYRVVKYIGAYAAAMNGVDAIVFTAGIGENTVIIRDAVAKSLTYLGVELDEKINSERRKDARCISTPNSKVKVWVIPTNEELMIAEDTARLVK